MHIYKNQLLLLKFPQVLKMYVHILFVRGNRII